MISKILWGFGAAFVAMELCEYVINNILMPSVAVTLVTVFRGDVRAEVFPIIAMFVSFLFSFVYSKGYEGGGLMEGLRYGLYLGLIIMIPTAYGQYALYPIPYTIALGWFFYGLAKFLIMGMVVGLVFGKKSPGDQKTG